MRASLLAGAALAASASAAAAGKLAKRGWVADGCTGSSCADPALLGALGWYYAYNPTGALLPRRAAQAGAPRTPRARDRSRVPPVRHNATVDTHATRRASTRVASCATVLR